ncbi:MAG: hypothetical protein RJA29_1955, partial [Pseudomonadota bacterium]
MAGCSGQGSKGEGQKGCVQDAAQDLASGFLKRAA